MKIAQSLAAAALVTAASFGSPAFAADISAPIGAVAVLPGGENYFGSVWWDLNSDAGDTFTNRYVFSVTGSGPSDLAAQVGSASPDASRGLDITNLSLYSFGGDLLSTGTAASTGAFDFWQLTADSLAVGNYYVQVSGTVVGSNGGAFGGSLALAPVPEPETYGMMLAGLGVLGFIARRRRAAKQ